MPLLPTFLARFTLVSGPTGDVQTDATHYFLSQNDDPEVAKDGTVTFAISQVDGYSFDGGSTWTGPPAGFAAVGSSLTMTVTAVGTASISAPLGPTSDSQVRLDCTSMGTTPVVAHRTTAGTTSAQPNWPNRLLSAFDLTAFLECTLHTKWDHAGGFGGNVQAVVLKAFSLQGDYVIITYPWITKPCTTPESHIEFATEDPGEPWQAYGSPGPVPHIDDVDPPAGSRGGGTPVTITGEQFDDGCTVLFGDLAADNVVVESQYKITCTTPLAGSPDAHAPGVVQVTVVNSDGTASVP